MWILKKTNLQVHWENIDKKIASQSDTMKNSKTVEILVIKVDQQKYEE